MSRQAFRIAITTGDPDGIGTEITAKALQEIRPQKNVYFYLWRSPDCPRSHLQRIDKQFRRVTVTSWEEALRAPISSYKQIVDIASPLLPAHWVETSAIACSLGRIQGLATAPISKTSIKRAGFSDMGHTGILRRVSKKKDLFMAFVGDRFNVILVTDHIPISMVSEELTAQKIVRAARAANSMKSFLPTKFRNKPLGILGLNPHAGEDGLIGSEDTKIVSQSIKQLTAEGIDCVGPLVPDAAFLKENHTRFSFFVALYHDQGLIPFKMAHGQDTGVHITAGLPFVRTSVDHGTAKDIFGRNRANPNSMIEAIRWSINLVKKSDLKEV